MGEEVPAKVPILVTMEGPIAFLKFSGSEPLYRQLYRELRASILRGELAPGRILPPTRELARELGVSRNTVLQAYEWLIAEGYLTGRLGSGTSIANNLPAEHLSFVEKPHSSSSYKPKAPPRLSKFAQRAKAHPPYAAGPNIKFDFRPGLPGVADFPLSAWRQILMRNIKTDTFCSNAYRLIAGYLPLRETLSHYLGRARGIRCSADQIIIVNGSQQALDLVARVLVDPGDTVLIEDPHYPEARDIFLAAGAKLKGIAVDKDGLDVERLSRSPSSARFVYVTPSHQYPTGAVLPLTRRLALLAWAQTTGAYIVEDDYDSEYRYENRPIEAVQSLDRDGQVIYVGTFSKTMFPALRLAFLISPEPLVNAFTTAKFLSDRHTTSIYQEPLSEFIQDGHFERHLRKMRRINAGRRSALIEELQRQFGADVDIQGSNAGLHVIAWFPKIAASKTNDIVVEAVSLGVGVYSVAPCFLRPPRKMGLMLGYATQSEAEIKEGMRRLKQAFANRKLNDG